MELLIWCIGVLLLLIWFCVKPGRLSAAQAAPFYGVNHAHRGLYAQDPVSYTHLDVYKRQHHHLAGIVIFQHRPFMFLYHIPSSSQGGALP